MYEEEILQGLSQQDLRLLEINQNIEIQKQLKRTQELAKVQADQAKFQKQLSIAIVAIIGSFLLVAALWVLVLYLGVIGKYANLLSLLRVIKDLGYYDLTSPEMLVWCAEYPNFTELLFSKFLNRNFPKAVSLAFYSPPFSDYFNERNPQEAAIYLAEMEKYANFHGSASAQEIICGAWGFGEGIDSCLEECPIPYIPDAGAMTSTVLRGSATGLFLATSLLVAPDPATSTIAIVIIVGVAIGTALGSTQAILGRNRAIEQCNNLSQANCRVDTEQQCKK